MAAACDVHARHRAPVGRPHFDGLGKGGDQFASVSGDVSVHAALDGSQQGGFAVVAAADDHGHARFDRQPADDAAVGERHLPAQRIGRLEGNRAFQRLLRHPRAAGQHGAVGDEGHPAVLLEGGLQSLVVLVGVHVCAQRLEVAFLRVGGDHLEGVDDGVGDVLVEDGRGRVSEDRTVPGRELHLEPELDAVLRDGAGRALEDLGTRPGYAYGPSRGVALDRPAKGPHEEVRDRHPLIGRGDEVERKPHFLRSRHGVQRRRRSEGIGLHAVDAQFEVQVIPIADQRLVGAVISAVQLV